MKTPTLRTERGLHRAGYRLVAGMDEVGRGALAGPVSVGVVVVCEQTRSAPVGVADSKLLTPTRRQQLVPHIQRWALSYAVGHASPSEIDSVGIIAALRLAGVRALGQLNVIPDLVVLDGSHDWLTDPATLGLFALVEGASPAPPVMTKVKADLTCSSVAAASVLAKVERDALMCELAVGDDPYEWAANKGYACPRHLAALRERGTSEHHRRSWHIAAALDTASALAEPFDQRVGSNT